MERIWVHNPILFDAMIVTFAVYVYQQVRGLSLVKRILAFFGKYSMDMFLTHTFIFSLWPSTHNIVYTTTNPLVIYLTFVAMSLALAMLMGWVKDKTGYNGLIKTLRSKIS